MAVDLNCMSPDEREEYYKVHFDRNVNIKNILIPDPGLEHQKSKSEIRAAYLKHTTFVFEVYVNYDAYAHKFFTDGRLRDCGKILLSPKQKQVLQAWPRKTLKLPKVCFKAGTAFSRSLISLRLELARSTEDEKPNLKFHFYAVRGKKAEHNVLYGMVKRKLVGLDKNEEMVNDAEGFSWKVLESIARLFRVEPAGEEMWRRKKPSYHGPFVGDHSNEGYVEGLREMEGGNPTLELGRRTSSSSRASSHGWCGRS